MFPRNFARFSHGISALAASNSRTSCANVQLYKRNALRNGTHQKVAVKESIGIGQFLKMNEEALKPGARHHVHNVESLEVPKVVPVKNKKTRQGTKLKEEV
ncbi:hypothetical protein CYMTET_13733 [Cymbomonas tetramitiformis]|uniref:Uncharacterized protein n=1 Tax=Cymbomonas tetramitiformis TaxID=36881 RepID=A0AAE0GHH4_9CHLO|nr:hypothetical protein CYMTET_13733 [Cymbomonas tetramitiformis]